MTNTTSPSAELAHLADTHPAALWMVCDVFTKPGRRLAVADAILAALAAVPAPRFYPGEGITDVWGRAVAQVALTAMNDDEVAELVGLARTVLDGGELLAA